MQKSRSVFAAILMVAAAAKCEPTTPEPPAPPPTSTPDPPPTSPPDSTDCEVGFVCENFEWSGDHAAVINDGAGRTVWWNPDRWDTRHDLAYDSQDSYAHIDVHKAADPSLTQGHEDNADPTTNGAPGVPGVGVMRVHETAIASARLRTPVAISADRPAIVRFHASRFVTGGHWWEIALSPDIVGGEHTAIPGQENPMSGAIIGSGQSRGGPGHVNPVDSINVVNSGWPDDCSNATFVAVRQTIGGQTIDVVNQPADIAALTKVSPSEADELYPWEVRFWPDRVEVALDADRSGDYESVQSFATAIPWSTAYVHLINVSYHAQVHPPAPCNQGQDREFMWKAVQIGPIATGPTSVYPRETGTDNAPRRTGWMLTDVRDVQRFGAVGDLPQPNPAKYDNYGPVLLCSADTMLWTFYCPNRTAGTSLSVDLPDLSGVQSARLVYDIIRPAVEGQATLSVNGAVIGVLPAASTVRPVGIDLWARRSIEIPVSALLPGSNTVAITLAGDVRLDRLQIELTSAP
jgi:hypothetical protein